jgi:hypothetical protein
LFPLLVANDDAVKDLIPNPRNEQEYLERIDLLIKHPELRLQLGAALRERLMIDHLGNGWLDRLATVYKSTDSLTHNPRPLPRTPCATSDADISLSLWHAVADGKSYTADTACDRVGATLRHTAFVAKSVGDYSNARRFAWRAVRHDPQKRCSWRLLTITLLGTVGPFLKQCKVTRSGVLSPS